MKLHHIGIKVPNLEESIHVFERIGYKQVDIVTIDLNQCNKVVFMLKECDHQLIELVQPIDERSSIYNFKDGYHHICFDVGETPDFLTYFRSLKIGKIFIKALQAPAIGNRYITFAYLKNGLLIEFIL